MSPGQVGFTTHLYGCRRGIGVVVVVRRVRVVVRWVWMVRVVVGRMGVMVMVVVRGVVMGVAEVGRRRREDVGEVREEEQGREAEEEELRAVHGAGAGGWTGSAFRLRSLAGSLPFPRRGGGGGSLPCRTARWARRIQPATWSQSSVGFERTGIFWWWSVWLAAGASVSRFVVVSMIAYRFVPYDRMRVGPMDPIWHESPIPVSFIARRALAQRRPNRATSPTD
jgi:hypothetical protein